ncbi:glycosyl hydrolase [uncultured Spirosoma sp.]|uniref:glycosyl hydrolase n=1 Tax=uncultured Spirosoma sp. TaxID=278208 RepID=UPI00258E37C7|nr:glycosyl hydrolase [uncultured Spirosoma sp.]
MKIVCTLLASLLATVTGPVLAQSASAVQPRWPAITQQTRPWTRWWWMGSAVDNTNLTHLLTQYRDAGLGGVEITSIYGVKGTESQFIPFLSPTWMQRFDYTLTEAGRLGLGVDLAQASGWPFGGPWVTTADACRYVAYQTYALKAGQSLTEPVQYRQKSLVRTVGEPIDIRQVRDPIATNPDLQRHAFDQVRFEKPLPLQTLMAYGDKGQRVDLTKRVDEQGKLNWTAPAGNWTLYALFMGWHGKQVERAGPGGEGDVIDHFSKTATDHYLNRFNSAFRGHSLAGLRAFFNDSYEVDDAQGEGNWTPALLTEFQKRRGYDLRNYLPALLDQARPGQERVPSGNVAVSPGTAGQDADASAGVRPADSTGFRVLSDYRETLSDLLLDNYTRTWHDWAGKHGKQIRNQAHGSPANILDLYAATDIPEIEGTELLRIKFASSAANVTGKPLISSESATWDNEHFLSTLGDVKKDLDLFWLGGVNHVFYHGTNYSPQQAEWPGWLFYAAVHVNPNNSFWPDFGKLNQYGARVQSFLQQGKPDNDVLLYLPIYDAYIRPGKVLLQHFDGIEHGFKGLPVEQIAQQLVDRGYGFDYVSDRQINGLRVAENRLQTGGVDYQTLLVPDAKLMPLETFGQLLSLARNGATILMVGQLPADVPGLGNLAGRRATFRTLQSQLHFTAAEPGIRQATVGKGRVLVGATAEAVLRYSRIRREAMVDVGLSFVRRRNCTGQHTYFVVNTTKKPFDGWVAPATTTQRATLYNPMTEQAGQAEMRQTADGATEIRLQLQPGESMIVATNQPERSNAYTYQTPDGPAQPLTGPWQLTFLTGGPQVPKPVNMPALTSWTELNEPGVQAFSGSAAYAITFPRPAGTAPIWLLDLGKVAESARVQLNGRDLATLLGPTYQLTIPGNLLRDRNELTVIVSNGMANRMRDLDKRGVGWKKFYNINMSARLKENRGPDGLFTAEHWQPRPSGLLGPVTMTPLK